MRIYKVNLEHVQEGLNWSSVKVAAKNFHVAVEKAKKTMKSFERIESVELVATTD